VRYVVLGSMNLAGVVLVGTLKHTLACSQSAKISERDPVLCIAGSLVHELVLCAVPFPPACTSCMHLSLPRMLTTM
jgi:hypothetical protein